MDNLLTTKQAAKYLNCHPQTIYKNTELPSICIPGIGKRYDPKDIKKYLENNKHKPEPNLSQVLDNQRIILTSTPDYGIRKPNESGGSEMAKAKTKSRFNFGYGAIYTRKTKKGKIRWYLDYKDASGKRIQKVAPLATTKKEAEFALRDEVRKVFDGEYDVRRQKQNIKIIDFIKLYIENYSKPNKKSWKDDRYRLMRSADILGKNTYLTKISSLDIEKLKSAKLNEDVTHSTVNTYLRVLKRMFNIAMTWGYAQSNPVRKVRMYSEAEARRDRVLNHEEELRLLDSSKKKLRQIIIFALNTGMRRGEILNLKWEDIDFEERTILIKKSKSGKPRKVPINSRLFEELIKWKEENKNSHFLFTSSRTGKPFKTIRKSWESACKKAKIQKLRFHDLRRTFGSRLALAGVDLNRIKELLGHASIKTTEIYLHADSKDIHNAVEALCENRPKKGKKQDDLLHICDTKDSESKSPFKTSLFSVN